MNRRSSFSYRSAARRGLAVAGAPDPPFWWCGGSGMENHVRYGEAVYFHGADAAGGAPAVRVNGRPVVANGAAGSFFTLRRAWQPGDVVEGDFPMRLHVEAMPDYRTDHRRYTVYWDLVAPDR